MLLIPLALALTIIIGYTTYGWFTARVTSTGSNITTGTLLLNGSTNDEKEALFTASNCQPGDTAQNIEPLTIKNTGTLDLNIKTDVEVSYEKGGSAWANASKEHFKIQPVVKFGQNVVEYDKNNTAMSFDEFEGWLEGLLSNKTLKASTNGDGNGEYYEISGNVYLDGQADNEYQGVTASVNIIVDAEQTNKQTTT